MRGDITMLQANTPPKRPPKNGNNVVHVLAEVIRLLVVALLAAFGVRYIGG